MVITPLDMKYVYKRERYLEKRRSISESSGIPELSGVSGNEIYKTRVENFLSECSSYKEALSILETLYTDNKFDLLEASTQRVINDIIPMVDNVNLNNCIDSIKASDIGNINKDRLIETAKIYKSIDRIRKNHKNLSKRFNIEAAFDKNLDDKKKCYKICECIDTYNNLTPFIKYNIALEELTYLGYTGGNRIPKDILVENVTNYFLMRNNNTWEDIESYKRAISESKVLPEGSDSNVKFFTESYNTNGSSYWKDKINSWKVNPYKTANQLLKIAKESYGDMVALGSIINTINEFVYINQLDFDFSKLVENINEDCISGNEALNLISIIKENNIEDTEDLLSNLRGIWEAELNNNVYFDGSVIPNTFTSDEIDKFKMHNMIIDAQTVGDFLDQSEKASMKESPLNIKKILSSSNDKDLNESNLIDHVDANNYISMKIRSYSYNGNIEEAAKLLESNIKCINNILYGRNCIAYYSLDESRFDISIRSKYKVLLTEAEENRRGFISSDKELICMIENYTNALHTIDSSYIYDIADKLNDRSYAASISVEEASLIFEILSPYVEEGGMFDEFVELCKEECNPKYDKIKKVHANMIHEDFNLFADNYSRIKFCAKVMGLPLHEGRKMDKLDNAAKKIQDTTKKAMNIEDKNITKNRSKELSNHELEAPDTKADSKMNNDSSSSRDTSYEDGGGISINDAKLAWKGVKAKAKNADARQKEFCRDLDMEFNHMCKTIKQVYTVDHRTEIITGEVNRSISKVIKMAIGLVAAGAATGGVGAGVAGIKVGAMIAPILGLITAFAKSKFTSTKEKKMILDEIDIELQVLEREINRAEQSGSQKKYRQLLTIQKNLQRKRQEIYYGLAKKGSKIPMQATTGLRSRE